MKTRARHELHIEIQHGLDIGPISTNYYGVP
jgi:hypothetical protein